MRIRKRLAPSSIPISPLSDLQLHRSEAAAPPDQPSGQSMATRRWAFPRNDETQEKMKQKWQEVFGDDDEKWRLELEEKKISCNNDIRKIVSICGGEELGANKTHPPPSSSSAHQGDCKLVPLKKRKGSFERNPKEETVSAKMKSKTNKKCGDHIVQVDQEPVMN
ncbi:UNVERIFIED_CONTAM: hypothetical protein Scaly_0664600 [Sesamum calycinum]|uniref:Uncharacterized protein n=1 Tax=Sesamum calycinum TaxID=2727403 RepID=A0AAW2RUD7_9LAMI